MSIIARIFGLRGVLRGLDEADADPNPIAQFSKWFAFARRSTVAMPEACAVATATKDGKPSVRMVLLKSVNDDGFIFFTNYESRKGLEIEANPTASLLFHWTELHRQVRVEGALSRVSADESDAYFHSRPRGSQIGACASQQSSLVPDRKALEDECERLKKKYEGQEIPRPSYWGGYRLKPDYIEFWQGRPSRLHDRLCYQREGKEWRTTRLAP